ncbi:MAG: hypothetical protein JO236_04380 [Mycobacterium sp.]|uniref:hypothetical protein n=1 Tax=Mycobacterium sp. TaxID=1785 RepID=UPI001EC64A4C|nr:hypothetical protein [Mycobacterium sp.]MBW0016770.1 hypothetical protein [Mycobacterium sp.]
MTKILGPLGGPSGEPLCTSLIERYLRSRGRRYFRGQHDGEYFFLADVEPRRLHVHLEISRAHPDVFTIRVTPACFFPAANRALLSHFADAWNRQDRAVIAIVHGSSDPGRIGVAALRPQWLAQQVSFEDFASFVDRTLEAAVDLFAELTALTTRPLLRVVG